MPPTRQERRKAERAAAKRAPVRAGASDARGAAAARAHLNDNPGGDWTTQTEFPFDLFQALGEDVLHQRVVEGDREAEYAVGYMLLAASKELTDQDFPAAGTSPDADVMVGLEQCTHD